jgi:hypothetical protein
MDIKYCATSANSLIWQDNYKRELHEVREEFHHHYTLLVQLPGSQSW